MTENVLCTHCDAANPHGATFCTTCGAALRRAATGPTRRLAAPAVSAPRRCRACGGVSPAEALYCVSCGARLGHEAIAARSPALAPALATAAAGPARVQTVYVPVTSELPLVARALWFFFIGLPLGLAWVMIAWAFILTLIGLPVGLWMLTLMPQVMTLKQGRPAVSATPQRVASMAVRVVYFVLIGWWLSLVWMLLAWGVAATVIGLPLAFLMFERTGAVLTLSET